MRKVVFLITLLVSVFFTFNPTVYSQTYNMSSTQIDGCSGTFFDPQGGSDYGPNQNVTQVICSDDPGSELQLTFTSFNVETLYDQLLIYDGNGTSGTLIGDFDNSNIPGTILSSTGCLTLVFTSDNSVEYSGWEATISCFNCSDGVQNGAETGTDCGGPDCAACPTCDDGIQNGDETGVDCGGTSCVPCSCFNGVQDGNETDIDYGGDCGDCNNGIMDGAETGVDCGGPYCLPCNTNSTLYSSSNNCCTGSPIATVYPTNCDQIGTSAYNLNSPIIEMSTTAVSSGCYPNGQTTSLSGTPAGCGSYDSPGTWTQVDLADGVDYLQVSWTGGTGGGADYVGNGNTTTYHSYFQGPDCNNLTLIDCQPTVDFSSGLYGVYESSVSGLDPNQDVWIYTWNSGGKNFRFDFQFVGASSNPFSADECSPSSAIGEACNLGAQGASFTTPGTLCSGGNWGSNENTTFYSFTADATTGSLEIADIICNDGSNGNAQFGVWTDCNSIGTYGADFLGCAVGTATLTLSPLVPDQTYYIAADGFAGDNCTWGFTGTGIVLPIELGSLTAYHNGYEVELEWTTITELNNDYFTIQRTLDGKTFEDIAIVDGAGTSSQELYYSFTDRQPYQGISYYRIKQTDFDGKFEYTELISVRSGEKGMILVATYNLLGQEVGLDYEGVVIDLYSDGTTNKRFQSTTK